MNATPSDSHKVPFEDTVQVIPPAPARILEKRAARLRFLAPGHALGAYLEAMARLAEAQLTASQAPSSGNVNGVIPALPFDLEDSSHRNAWRRTLDIIISEMQLVPLPEPSQSALSRLREMQPAELESSAHAILNGNAVDRAASPFLAAALQVYWTGMASKVHAGALTQPASRCPVCGSPPVAAVIQSGRKLRYLCCSLCATHWYVPRLTCVSCASTAGLSYFAIDGDTTETKAETCSRCNTYLKLFYLESNPEAEAFADDLATLALDLLLSKQGYSRSSVNLFLQPE
jgi:FdhE protein